MTRTHVRCASLLACLASCKSQSGKSAPQDQTLTTPPPASDDAAPVESDAAPLVLEPAPPIPPVPLGLPATPSPDYNPTTPEKVALGALLFSEPTLSITGEHSCVSCHQAEHAWSSGEAIVDTATGKLNLRHTPALLNLAYHEHYYWDGRATPLEGQILGHWLGQLGAEPQDTVTLLAEQPLYAAHFQRAFEGEASADRAAEAIAAFLRSLRSGASPWDHYEAGDRSAVSADVIAGAKIFNERAGCATCHTPPLYTDLGYHGVGVPDRKVSPDLGRGKSAAEGASFKTPGLRSVSLSAPYFHNGSAATLDDVITIKEAAGAPKLTQEERRQLLLFLAALTPNSPASTTD
jgi:cytochrome c peroxidase